MQLREKKKGKPYDIWNSNNSKPDNELVKQKKLHPSSKRNKKNQLPHPGQSYNPDPEEHKKLLQKVLKKELEYQKRQETLKKALNVKIDLKELREDEKNELESGIKHLIKKKESSNANSNDVKPEKQIDEDDSENSSTDDAYSDYDEKDFEAIMKDKVVKEKRKTNQQRLRQLRDRLQRKAAKLRKLKNIRLSKFDAIKRMIKELNKKEKEALEKKKKLRHKKIKNERLGQKFEQSDPIYCLSDELPSSLRTTSCPMNAIVREQLESFQSRLMVEPTSYQVKKRKYKKKNYDRSEAGEQDEA